MADWMALDTEADSLHAYPEKLCLIQITIPGQDVLADPLAGLDLSNLFAATLNRHTILMHGADYDVRLFKLGHNFVPNRIFDTMLAARLHGADFQLGCRIFARNSSGWNWKKPPKKPTGLNVR